MDGCPDSGDDLELSSGKTPETYVSDFLLGVESTGFDLLEPI